MIRITQNSLVKLKTKNLFECFFNLVTKRLLLLKRILESEIGTVQHYHTLIQMMHLNKMRVKYIES